MQNELRYRVGSREIVDLVSAMRSATLTLSPYFQRNLVWRDAHRRDFIETILKGFPFPQIFLARGPIDLESMSASQAVVDGQQRLNTIRDYVNGKLTVGGTTFKELPPKDQEAFLKYEVPVIDFDLDVGDPRLKDVFHRLNRTYYALSAIEKLASEYSASEFMLVARVLAGEILASEPTDEDSLSDVGEAEDGAEPLAANVFSRDPGVDDATWAWLTERAEGPFSLLIKEREKSIFTPFEFDRKVPLMFTLNVMCSYLTGYYERNDKVRRYLDDKADNFPEKLDVISAINDTAEYIAAMDFDGSSMWYNKGNFFTLVVELARSPELRLQEPSEAAAKLSIFAAAVPQDYALAAREAVGRRGQRELRGQAVRAALSADVV